MWFTNEWFVFNNVIDKKTCDRIKNLGRGKWVESTVESNSPLTEEKRLTGRNPDYENNTKARISNVYWTHDQWLYDLIWPFMLEANKVSGWNLDIHAAESMQLTRYQKGGFYTWHRDGSSDSLSAYDKPENSFMHGKVRKLSLSLILNDNFEGGDLEFCSYGEEKSTITPIEAKAGDMIFFTSGMEHRVAPVTKGVRYSLVNWFVGPPVR
jgi:PKHD-type hydroxylase